MLIETISTEALLSIHEKLHGYKPLDLPGTQSVCFMASIEGQAVATISCQTGKHQVQLSDGSSKEQTFGMMGHYATCNRQAGLELIAKAMDFFQKKSISPIIGPMDGSTWGRYRFLLPNEEEKNLPLFFSEPSNPLDYASHFQDAGLTLIELYESRVSFPIYERAGALQLKKRLIDRGFRFNKVDLDRYDEDLKELFKLSLDSFSHNPYYMPISEALFLEKYRALKSLIDPDFVILAYDESNQLAGFAFAFPDRFQPDRIVLKTVATTPGSRILGLGISLIDEIHTQAQIKGFHQVIHALMHVNNASLQISQRYQTNLLHRYGLFGLTIDC